MRQVGADKSRHRPSTARRNGARLFTRRGTIGRRAIRFCEGRPLGTDFSNIYAAGTYVLEGRPQAPFDPALQYAREQAIFGASTPFFGWHYPPFFLFVAAPLALLPYLPALLLWQAATLIRPAAARTKTSFFIRAAP